MSPATVHPAPMSPSSASMNPEVREELAALRKLVMDQQETIEELSQNNVNMADMIDKADLDSTTIHWLNQTLRNEALTAGAANDKRGSVVFKDGDCIVSSPQSPRGRVLTAEGGGEDLTSWNFDVWKFSENDFSELSIKIFELFGMLEHWNIPRTTAESFFNASFSGYRDENPYHNKRHAFDVLQTSSVIVASSHGSLFHHVDILGVFVSAIIHDIDHPGNTNMFEINSNSELAVRYNDVSVLETTLLHTHFQAYSLIPRAIFWRISTPRHAASCATSSYHAF